jgi:hypothetical protein
MISSVLAQCNLMCENNVLHITYAPQPAYPLQPGTRWNTMTGHRLARAISTVLAGCDLEFENGVLNISYRRHPYTQQGLTDDQRDTTRTRQMNEIHRLLVKLGGSLTGPIRIIGIPRLVIESGSSLISRGAIEIS